jgi:hypothetical protein
MKDAIANGHPNITANIGYSSELYGFLRCGALR